MTSPDNETLSEVLTQILEREVFSVDKQYSPHSSSFTIEELKIQFGDGTSAVVIFKNLGSEAMLDDARAVKPEFIQDPLREIQVYRSLLSLLDAGTPSYYGSVVDPAVPRYWLFTERVDGLELYQVGDFDAWLAVARWLGWFQAQEICAPGLAGTRVPELIRCDAAYYSTWMERAQANFRGIPQSVARNYNRVVETLDTLPQSMIHGEFYASNIVIQRRENGLRVCPVDWEMAAIGPGLLDVAALASGKWTSEQRQRIANAYCSVLPDWLKPPEFETALACCRLQIAIQWLGWSRHWNPPKEHAHDWLTEVTRLVTEEPLRRLLE